jgi:poly-gamma-glutamate capsule biosynthesis protein CapA/YwtB (metallophosphatase superfamily)
MPNALSMRSPEKFRNKEAELSMRIKEPFNVVVVGDLIQMVPFSNRQDPDIQALRELMKGADVTLANNENKVIDRLTFRGPISHMEAPSEVADDWANLGIAMVSTANNHTFDNGDVGLVQNLEQLKRVGIEYVGTDYNLTEARLARFRTTTKGTIGFIGAYSETVDYSQLYGLPKGDPIIVTPEQLQQLKEMQDSLFARSNEVPNPIDRDHNDPESSVLLFGRIFHLAETVDSVTEEAASIKKRLEHHLNSKGPVTYKNNTLCLEVYQGVTESQMSELRKIAGDEGTGAVLNAFGAHFKVTDGPGELKYDMHAEDEREILREVRSGKQLSDILVFTIHWHQNRFTFQKYSFDHYPADYQIKLAHEVVDNGADLFFAHGVHTLKGVEIYKGKPIFYGVNNFVFQNQRFRSWRDDADKRAPVPLSGPIVGDGESNESRWAWLQKPENFEAILGSTRYVGGKLVEVLIYPVDLGVNRPSSEMGTPRRPTLEHAQRILERVAEYSQPFGTTITIENGVGIISIQPQ